MDVVVAPRSTVGALCFVFGGIALGTASGLVPGLHANYVALLLGVATFAAATVVGLVPARFRAKRTNRMGVLILPIVVG